MGPRKRQRSPTPADGTDDEQPGTSQGLLQTCRQTLPLKDQHVMKSIKDAEYGCGVLAFLGRRFDRCRIEILQPQHQYDGTMSSVNVVTFTPINDNELYEVDHVYSVKIRPQTLNWEEKIGNLRATDNPQIASRFESIENILTETLGALEQGDGPMWYNTTVNNVIEKLEWGEQGLTVHELLLGKNVKGREHGVVTESEMHVDPKMTKEYRNLLGERRKLLVSRIKDLEAYEKLLQSESRLRLHMEKGLPKEQEMFGKYKLKVVEDEKNLLENDKILLTEEVKVVDEEVKYLENDKRILEDKKKVLAQKRMILEKQNGSSEPSMWHELTYTFLQAFIFKMHSSKGRDFVRELLKAAAYVCFGREYCKYVSALSIGPSRFTKEGFWVKTKQESAKNEKRDSPKQQRDLSQGSSVEWNPVENWDISESLKSLGPPSAVKGRKIQLVNPGNSTASNASFEMSSEESSSTHSVQSSVSVANVHPDLKFIYPDCVVISLVNDPVYIFVVETTSSNDLNPKVMTQLRSKMIGAGMHQTEIFGIAINHVNAKIQHMSNDAEEKIVNFSPPLLEYMFPVEGEFLEFFRQIVAILNYGVQNIRSIYFEEPDLAEYWSY